MSYIALPTPPILKSCSHPHMKGAHSYSTDSTNAKKMANLTQDDEIDTTSTTAQPSAVEMAEVTTPEDPEPNPL
jgi:hypothetical protein